MSEEKNLMGEALDWDSEIEKESEFTLLPDGEYPFTVINMERQRFDGSEKMAPCPMAKITIEINTREGSATIFDRLMLNKKMEWKLSSFFGSIGQKKHGDKLKMDWGRVVGSTGHAKIGTREYNGKKYNEIRSYVYAEDAIPPKATEYKAGSF